MAKLKGAQSWEKYWNNGTRYRWAGCYVETKTVTNRRQAKSVGVTWLETRKANSTRFIGEMKQNISRDAVPSSCLSHDSRGDG